MEVVIQNCIRQLAAGHAVPGSPALLRTLPLLGLAVHEEGGQVRLSRPLELLDAVLIKSLMRPGNSCDPVVCWQIDSTNTYLMERAAGPDFHGAVCLAEQQVAGRGRRGRSWVSPFGKNVYMSLGQRLPGSARALSGLSLVAGICVVRVLRALGATSVGLKWPNDVMQDEGKLAGILTEIASINRDFASVVIGIGINLRLDATDLGQIDQPPAVVGNAAIARNQLVAALLDELLPGIERFAATGFAPFREEWSELDVFRGGVVRVLFADREVEGVSRGVDEAGNLLVETTNGIETFNAGEVSLRRKVLP